MSLVETTHPIGKCELQGCGKEFLVPPSATNKRFCCAEHKTEWHRRRREAERQALREKEGASK